MSEISPVCYSDPGMTNTNMQFAVLDVDADAPENQTIDPELEVRMGCVLSENFVFTILYQTCKMWRTKKARLVQDGEFIDVFLLPYDGLYDALVVSTLVIYPGEISVWTALRLSLDILLLPTRQYLCWEVGTATASNA